MQFGAIHIKRMKGLLVLSPPLITCNSGAKPCSERCQWLEPLFTTLAQANSQRARYSEALPLIEAIEFYSKICCQILHLRPTITSN